MPFYTYVSQFIKSAGGTWSWATDLGSSIVNSYSFYNIGSPFLWLSVLFPARWVPFLMVPLFMLKFGGIAAASCLYLSRYAKSRNMLIICSLVYAFCGFNVYNIFFNHMLDPVVIFPLMLWALDGFMYEGRRGFFALFVGLALLNSYFFFVGNVVFILLYFIVRLATREYHITAKKFGLLLVEVLIGLGLGMALALPSFLNLLGNPRVDNFANGFGMLLYGNVHQYFNIIRSMFLPPDPPYLPNIFTEGTIKWTSMSLYLPIVGMGGVFAYCRARKGGSVKILLFICLVMAMVPFLNSSFYAFNSSYYARWYYMPLLMAAFATLRSLEDYDIDLRWGARLTFIFTATYAIYGLVPAKKDGEWEMGVVQRPPSFWLLWLLAMLASGLFAFVLVPRRRRARFAALLLGAVMGFSSFYAVAHISLGKFEQWQRDANYRAQQYDGTAQLALPEGQFYRIDEYGSDYDNLGLWLDKSCLQTFNSVVTPSIMEFYPLVGVKRDVSSKPELANYPLRGLLSVRFMVMPEGKEDAFLMEEVGAQGWRYWKTEGPFAVYENENYVPLGFTYDRYVTMDNLNGVTTGDRSAILMEAIGLTAEQEGRYRRLFEGQAVTWEALATNEGGKYVYQPPSYQRYTENAAARRASSSYYVIADATGFTSLIELEKENLVFYAVPYDPGFTATVNGVPTEVLKVSGGMMAVLAPAGDNEIIFTYRTPGFAAGIAISLLSLVLLCAYLLLARQLEKRSARRKAALPAAALPAAGADDAENPPSAFEVPGIAEAPPGEAPETAAAVPDETDGQETGTDNA
ncbi:MAG: YfhO family protein [Oscillospiraceae bacterium]